MNDAIVIPVSRTGQRFIDFWRGREDRIPDLSAEPMDYLTADEQKTLDRMRREHYQERHAL